MTLRPFTRRHLLTAAATAVLAAPRIGLAQEKHEVVEMALGAADAPVTLVEYASFTCPHCAAFQRDVLPLIKANYIDPGRVRLVFREVYFDRPGLWASMIAHCAGPDRYFGVADLLFERQQEWAVAGEAQAIMAELYAIGRQAGLTDAAMEACMTDQAFAQALVAEYQKNATADAIDATPTFLINGEKAENMPYEEFESRLNAALGL